MRQCSTWADFLLHLAPIVVRLLAVFLGAGPAAVPRRVHPQPVIAEQVQQTVGAHP
jgi:hypothetical protein